MNKPIETIIIILACYLFGSIPFGLLIGLSRGVDIRKLGSGNIGATNVLRILGKGPGILVFVMDTFKGLAAVLISKAFHLSDYLIVAGAFASVIGHTFSPFLGFKGGKGVATSLGVIFGLNWIIALIAFVLWGIIVAITRYVSLSSIIASSSVPLMMMFWKEMHVPIPFQAVAIIAVLGIILKHIPNIKRLLNGTEPKIGTKVKLN